MKIYRYPPDNILELHRILQQNGFKVIGVNKDGEQISVMLDNSETKDPIPIIQNWLQKPTLEVIE